MKLLNKYYFEYVYVARSLSLSLNLYGKTLLGTLAYHDLVKFTARFPIPRFHSFFRLLSFIFILYLKMFHFLFLHIRRTHLQTHKDNVCISASEFDIPTEGFFDSSTRCLSLSLSLCLSFCKRLRFFWHNVIQCFDKYYNIIIYAGTDASSGFTMNVITSW